MSAIPTQAPVDPSEDQDSWDTLFLGVAQPLPPSKPTDTSAKDDAKKRLDDAVFVAQEAQGAAAEAATQGDRIAAARAKTDAEGAAALARGAALEYKAASKPVGGPAVIAETGAPWVFPPARGAGTVVVKLPSAELKLDSQSAAGTDKAKIKVNGVHNAKGTIDLEWTRHVGTAVNAMIWAINPNNPIGNKGPRDVRHPKFALNGISHLVVTKVGDVEVKGDHRKVTIDVMEWTPPPPPKPGATTTPTDPAKWSDAKASVHSVASGEGTTSGQRDAIRAAYKADNAPKTSP